LCLLLIVMLLLSCRKDGETHYRSNCGVQHPLTELDWLANLAQPCEETEQIGFVIYQAIYNDEQTVFFRSIVCAACDVVFKVTLLDCEGKVIKTYEEGDQNSFEAEVNSVETIFNCYDN
jgi:hypothetical protein